MKEPSPSAITHSTPPNLRFNAVDDLLFDPQWADDLPKLKMGRVREVA